MKRALVTAVAVLAILLQGLGTAWAAHARVPVAASSPATGDMGDMPCHAHHAKTAPGPLSSTGCCGEHCTCPELCGLGTNAAVPVQTHLLDDYIAAHFEALQLEPVAAPAHALNRFRPPIAPAS